MNVDLLLTNALIVTVDANNTILKNASIAISQNTITDIIQQPYPEGISAKKVIDCTGKLLMPGLINAHTHASMTMFRGLADDLPLKEWLHEHIFPAEARWLSAQSVRIGAQIAIHEMLLSGTTTFVDMYYFEQEVAQVAKQAGIRCLLSEGLLQFPVPNNPTPEDSLRYTEQLIHTWQNDEHVRIAVGPHAIYTNTAETLKQARALAAKYDVPINIHLSETVGEYDECLETTGFTPLQRLFELGVLDGRTIANHCVYLSQSDIMLAARCKIGVVNNPQCNMKLVSGVAPIPQLQEKGVTVALGTDGVVSNNSLDMFAEMKAAALIHKINHNDPALLSAQSVLRMATIEGAKAIGRESEIGSLEKGKRADLLIVNLQSAHLQPIYSIESQIVYAMKGSDVESVLVNGAFVVENRRLLNLSLEQALAEMQVLSDSILQSKR